MTRLESLELLEAVRKTLANTTEEKPSVIIRQAIDISCIATTLLVIAHALVEKE